MELPDVLRTLADFNARGLVRAVGAHDDGTPRYELTDKGRMALAEAQWKAV